MEKGNVKSVDGGEAIVQELEYAENTTYKRYTGLISAPLAA